MAFVQAMSFDSLFLYNVTLQHPSSSVMAVVGQFQGKKSQEIVIAKSSVLEVWKVNSSTGKLIKVFAQDVFGSIRAIASFRIAGSSKDYLSVTSDSGKYTILQLSANAKKFQTVFNEPFAKTGMRRLSPGQYLSVDAKGRAVMLSAVEKNKLVYVLNRDSENNLTVSSPLEANRNRILTFASCGLDVGYENPLFASIEIDYGDYEYKKKSADVDDEYDNPKKSLTFYELDLGLNHVVKKHSEVISESSSFLLSLPGGNDGPSGVLVGCHNFVQYKSVASTLKNNNEKQHILPIPSRSSQAANIFKTNSIICGVVHVMKSNKFFVLLQSNFGDLFKVTINYNSNERMDVESMDIKYFDTIPICNSLIILKSGFLLADTQHGDKILYQFVKLGDNDNESVYNSHDYFNTTEEIDDVTFMLRPLENLQVVDTIPCLGPLISSKFVKNNESENERLISLCGAGSRSSLKVLNRGLAVTEIVTSELPSHATRVFTSKLTAEDKYDRYLVISFSNSTLVLSIGESVEEVENSGFETEQETIGVQQMGRNSVMQIHSDGIIHLNIDEQGNTHKVNEWFPPAGVKVTTSTSTDYQLAVGLSNRELVYFELNDEEKLIEYQERKELPGQILSLTLGDIPEGKLRSNFLAVSCNNQTLQVLSVDPSNTLGLVTTQALSSNASSVLLLLMTDSVINEYKNYQLYLHIGLESGIYVKTLINTSSGHISDKVIQYLGPHPLKITKIKTGAKDGENSVLVFSPASNQTFVGFLSSTGFKLLPLAYQTNFHYGSGFNSEDCPNGLVGVNKNELMILTLEDLDNEFKIVSFPLRFTPKKFAFYSQTKDPSSACYVIQSDANTVSPFTEASDEQQLDYTRKDGIWASCLQVINTNILPENEDDEDEVSTTNHVLQTIEFNSNETVFDISRVYFQSKKANFIVVSSAENFLFVSSENPKFYLKCYEILENLTLKFLHQTEVEKPAASLEGFAGRLLAGVGKTLRLYDIGQKQLLRKAEVTLGNLNNIVKIQTQGYRIFVADIRQSITFTVYKPKENAFIPFADDIVARYVTAFTTLDYDTVIGGDKFGNLWVLRCPEEPSSLSDEDPSGVFITTQDSYLGGAPYRLNMFSHYFLNDIPTAFHKKNDPSGLNQSIIYTGLQGTIGVLLPILTKSEINFLQLLEKEMAAVSELMVVGRDHLMYRSYYAPRKGVVDGDLCEKFGLLNESAKNKIALSLDKSVKEIEKKILDIRLRMSF